MERLRRAQDPEAASKATSISDLPSPLTLSNDALPLTSIPPHPTLATSPPRRQPLTRLQFALTFFSLCLVSFLSAMDLTAVSTALPTVVKALPGGGQGTFVWIGSAFALSGTAFLPWTGGLAQIFGRKVVLLASVLLFSIGSVVCGSARSIPILLVGRAIQGLGDGGIISLAEIIVSDLVPLSERGTWEGVLGSIWAVASVVGPPIGGALSTYASWRWIFYLNLPISAIAVLFVCLFFHPPSPRTSWKEKMRRMDWIGNFLVIAATTAVTFAITFGGIRYPWSSPAVVVPFALGAVGLVAFVWYELEIPLEPTVPPQILSNRTSLVTYLAVFLHGVVALAVIYVFPTYLQACKGANADRSGVMILPLAFTVAPAAIAAAVWIEVSGTYRIQNTLGWMLSIVGLGLFTLLTASSGPGLWIGTQIPAGLGIGMLFTSPQFPALAPLSPKWAAKALALFTFVSSFGQTFGIVVGDVVLQNRLHHSLPSSLSLLDSEGKLVTPATPLALVPLLSQLAEPLQGEVRDAFARACRDVWIVLLPLAVIGLISCMGLKAFELQDEIDDEFGMR